MSPNRNSEDNSSLKRLATLLKPYSTRMTMVVLMSVALAVFNMLLPAFFIKLIFNRVFPTSINPEGNIGLLWMILPAILVVYFARNLLYFLSKYSSVVIGENLCFNLRNRLFENLQQMSLKFYRDNKPGRISSRVMDDSFQIQTFIQDEFPKLLQASFLFLGLIAWLYAMNWQLALASTVVLPLHLICYLKFKRPIKQASKTAREQLEMVTGNLIEKFLGAEVVKGFTAEDRENREFIEATDKSRRSQLISKRYHVTQKIIADMIVGCGTIFLLGFGAWQVLGPRHMLPGDFLAFFTLVVKLYPTVLELMSGFAKLTRSSASVDRVFEMLETQLDEAQVPGQTVSKIRGELRFNAVSFCYADGSPVLKNINLKVAPGQVCAIVGPSGAGKSTLVNLVPRFIDPDLGSIHLDGHRLEDYDLRHLREAIGIAFQECFLFNSSILENLLYANPEATMKQVIEVAKRTGAHDVIMKLSDGYDTIVGEEGVSLSRGEKQRINLARGMLKNPKILILDEATASIDIASESQIVPEILDFMKGKTTLMITHRPELLKHADVVVNLVDGRVVYAGPGEGMPQLVLGPAAMPDLQTEEEDGEESDGASTEARRRGRRLPAIGLTLLLGLTAVFGGAPQAAMAQDAGTETAVVENAGRLLPAADLSVAEIADLLDLIVSRLQVEMGYRLAGNTTDISALPPANEVRAMRVLVKANENEITLLQLGYRTFASQPPHLWIYGITIPAGGEAKPADPIDAVVKLVEEGRQTREAARAAKKATDLATEKIILSYVEASRALQMLKVFGYTVGEAGAPVDPNALPIVVEMPPTQHSNLPKSNGNRDADFGPTTTDPINELIVLYDPSQPEQFSGILDRIRRIIDVPARQIIIEAMVLEISEVGLSRLGVEWELSSAHSNLSALKLGRLTRLTPEDLAFRAVAENIFGEFQITLEALVEENLAEVLSRPHVLTLDNRMAHIRIVRRLPIVTSINNPNANTFTVQFTEKVTGITLNVRPHVSSDGEEISMQILTTVAAEVPGEDVVVFNNNDEEVARSPTITEREVRTTTRVANNTPFIIGGLVAKDDTEDTRKVPILGDLPVVGQLFRNDETRRLKREVIIVITPYVLPEGRLVSRTLPMDKDAFDSFDNKLFRASHRIRAEDVFDLRFLTENLQLQQMRSLAEQVARRNAELGRAYPFDRFVEGRIPGERVLVYRQMYEVIKRRAIERQVAQDKLILFVADSENESGFDVEFLAPMLQKYGWGGVNNKAGGLKDKALALTYTMQQFNDRARGILSQPVPEIKLVDCPNRDEWSRLLWEMNQPGEDGKQRFTILIQNEKDITRLKRAVVLKRTVELNVEPDKVPTLKDFTIGRLLLMPAVQPDKVYLIDDETAKYFFSTEQYYPVVRQELHRDIQALKTILKDPAVTPYLEAEDLRRIDAPLEWAPPKR